MSKHHHYETTIRWTGNQGSGTSGYRDYGRNHVISTDHKPDILGSSDPVFRGDRSRHNPEDLLVSSLSGCHMLWYLHLCTEAGVVVIEYVDRAVGVMEEAQDGAGRFNQVTLHPTVTVADESMREKAEALHSAVGKFCFIARSVNFPVHHVPVVLVGENPA